MEAIPRSDFVILDCHHSFSEVDSPIIWKLGNGYQEFSNEPHSESGWEGWSAHLGAVGLKILNLVLPEANIIILGIGIFAISIDAISSRTS